MEYIPWAKFITNGDYFTYHGVKYGKGTKFQFESEYYQKALGKYMPRDRKETFNHFKTHNGKQIWCCGFLDGVCDQYEAVDPDNDIKCITDPIYYLEQKELVNQRLNDGTWVNYIGMQTLFYLFCLLVSPLFNEWYLIWTIGLYVYLRTSYITLSKP